MNLVAQSFLEESQAEVADLKYKVAELEAQAERLRDSLSRDRQSFRDYYDKVRAASTRMHDATAIPGAA